jgi:hypothetical protein
MVIVVVFQADKALPVMEGVLCSGRADVIPNERFLVG